MYLHGIQPVILETEHQGSISHKEATKYCNYSLENSSLLARQGKLRLSSSTETGWQHEKVSKAI